MGNGEVGRHVADTITAIFLSLPQYLLAQ